MGAGVLGGAGFAGGRDGAGHFGIVRYFEDFVNKYRYIFKLFSNSPLTPSKGNEFQRRDGRSERRAIGPSN